jgi:hypothetical protein
MQELPMASVGSVTVWIGELKDGDGLLHGWHSVSGWIELSFLPEHGHEVVNLKLPDEGFEATVHRAQAEYGRHWLDVVVGSSSGSADESRQWRHADRR